MIVTEEQVDKILVSGRNHATTSLLTATSWSLRSTSIARSIKLRSSSPNSVPRMSPSSTSSRRTMSGSSSVFEGEPMDDSAGCSSMSSRPAGPAPDNRRFVIVAGDALAIMTFAGDCGCESSSKGIDDLITGLAEVFDQPLYLFKRLLPRVPEFLLGLDNRHIKPLSFLCPLPFGIDQDWLPLGKNPPIPLLPPSQVRHIPGTTPDNCVTPTILEIRLEGCDYFVKPKLPCVGHEQPTLHQNSTGEGSEVGNLRQKVLP